jgi:hypothetical protein
MTCLETYATLRIFSRTPEPAVIGASLGIDATDPIPLDPLSKYSNESEERRLSSSNCQCRLRDRHLLFLGVRGAGWSLSRRAVMRELSQLGLSIWWDVYFANERKA